MTISYGDNQEINEETHPYRLINVMDPALMNGDGILFRVRPEPDELARSERGNFVRGAYVDLQIEVSYPMAQLTIYSDDGLNEENCQALIGALTAALETAREQAKARGHYDWVAAGKPDKWETSDVGR